MVLPTAGALRPLALALPLALLAPPAAGAEEAARAPLTVETVEVTPASPGPETLCTLHVRVANHGDLAASDLGFEVRIGGRAVPALARRRYQQAIEPGSAARIRLPNFWSSESGRPPPADRTLEIEVALTAAHWVEIERTGDSEVRRPLGPVEGLPSLRRLSLAMAEAPAPRRSR